MQIGFAVPPEVCKAEEEEVPGEFTASVYSKGPTPFATSRLADLAEFVMRSRALINSEELWPDHCRAISLRTHSRII